MQVPADFIMFAMDCSTFSRVREIPRDDTPPPIRSPTNP